MSWLVAAFLAFQGCILSLVNTIVPDDYMDEIFHGPQAREYCRGAFTTWHPKITTFPGIYFLGSLYGWARWTVQALVSPLSMDAACATPYLRSLNILLSAACLLVLRDILATYRQPHRHLPHHPNTNHRNHKQQHQYRHQHCQQRQHQQDICMPSGSVSAPSAAATTATTATTVNAVANATCTAVGGGLPAVAVAVFHRLVSEPVISPELHALLLALYPLHWFFSILYYTDVASLLFLLLAQLQVARRCFGFAALAGGLAVLCRQTNVVWVAFLLGEAALKEVGLDWAPALRRQQQQQRRRKESPQALQAAGGSSEVPNNPSDKGCHGVSADATAAAAAAGSGGVGGEEEAAGLGLLSQLQVALGRVWRRRSELAARLWPLLLPPAGFAAFLIANGGSVVLGDKEAHQAVRHGAQLLYFAGWVALMLGPQLLGAVGTLHGAARRRPLTALLTAVAAVAAAAAVGHVSTMVHPYMLADNRHYVFYMWRRLLGRSPRVKYLLAPVYAAAWALLLSGLLRRVSVPWVAGFTICLVAQLLPAWLLELRYFTPGFYLIALRIEPPGRLQALAMLLMYGAINAVTMYMFLYRPYRFADGSVGRFLW